jgi:hypothetical protein
MIYKAIPGPKVISSEKGDFTKAVSLYADIINANSVDGWEYHSMETITVEDKTGCALKPTYSNYTINMLIFCKKA